MKVFQDKTKSRESKISVGNFTQESLWNSNISEPRSMGIPIGNLTSQLFANIYMNKFDYYVKQVLRVKYYVRYTDDFVVISRDKKYLTDLIGKIEKFLATELRLEMHPNKVFIRKYSQGIDFLGYIIFPKYRLLRTKTKQRMFNKMKQRISECKAGIRDEESAKQSLCSYLGVLSHANNYKVQQELLNQFWFWMKE